MYVAGRELGHYERYSLTRTLCGVAPTVVYIATLHDIVEQGRLLESVDQIMEAYPILECRIEYYTTRHPRYVHDASLNAADVVNVTPSTLPTTVLLLHELKWGQEVEVSKAPLWRVIYYDGAHHRIAITINHTLCDGVGGRNLTGQLLQLLGSGSSITPSIPCDQIALPPSLEETIDVSPLSVPENDPEESSIWPNPPLVAPYTRDMRVKLIHISAEDLLRLKTVSKSHHVQTLQPLIHAITLASLSSAVQGQPIKIASATPISLRDPALGHPYATGNYIGDYTARLMLEPSTRFWAFAREYAATMKDPEVVAESRRTMGLLQFLPDSDPSPYVGKTEWEVWVENGMRSTNPFAASVEVSNLGMMVEHLPHVREITFAQPPSPTWGALTINPITLRGGSLVASVLWRDGICEDALVESFIRTFECIVHQVSGETLDEAATFQQLR